MKHCQHFEGRVFHKNIERVFSPMVWWNQTSSRYQEKPMKQVCYNCAKTKTVTWY